MNINQFLSYRDHCPLCGNKLNIIFHSHKSQKIRFEEDRLNVLFNLDGLKKKHMDYKVGYSFSLEDNSFRIEFYTKDERRFDIDSPLFLINRFKELNNNLKGYHIYKHCLMCWCYWYGSEYLNLDFSKAEVEDFLIEKEYFGLTAPADDNSIKVFKLMNYYNTNKSAISCFIGFSAREAISDYSIPANASQFTLPLIRFVSKEETMDKIKKILLFS